MTYLATIHKFDGGLAKEKVDVIFVLQSADKIGLVQMLQVILLSSQLLLDYQRVSG